MANRSATGKAQQSSSLGGSRPEKYGFARFKRLPAELRARIWREAIFADETLYPSTNRAVNYKIIDVLAKDGTRQTYIVHDQLSDRVRQSSVANASAEAWNETWTTARNFPQPVALDYRSFLCSDKDAAQIIRCKFRHKSRVSLPGRTLFLGPRTEFPLTKGPVDVAIDIEKPGKADFTDPHQRFDYAEGKKSRFADKGSLVEVLGRLFGTGLRQLSLYNSSGAIEIYHWSSWNIDFAPIRHINDDLDNWIDVPGRSYYVELIGGHYLSPIEELLPRAVEGLFPSSDLQEQPSVSAIRIQMAEMSLLDASLVPIDVYQEYDPINRPAWYAEVLRLEPGQKNQALDEFLASEDLQSTVMSDLVWPNRCLRELEDLATLLSTHFASFRWISYLVASIPNYPWRGICEGQEKNFNRSDFRDPIRTVRCGDCGKKRFHFVLQQPQHPESKTGCRDNKG